MNNFVRAALDLVRADAEASGVPGPVYVDADWEFYDDLTVGSPELIVTVADRVQDDIIEHLWPASATNWPPCPTHARTHPLRPAVVDGQPVWTCTDGRPYAPIGSVFTSRHQARRARRGRKQRWELWERDDDQLMVMLQKVGLHLSSADGAWIAATR